jgi:hypothetical protein
LEIGDPVFFNINRMLQVYHIRGFKSIQQIPSILTNPTKHMHVLEHQAMWEPTHPSIWIPPALSGTILDRKVHQRGEATQSVET